MSRRLPNALLCLLLLGSPLPKRCAAGSPPPVITVQPVCQSIPVHGTVTFSVAAASDTALCYQWRKNGGNIGGATLSSYTFFNVQTNDAGIYSVKVSNAEGNVTSSNATLTVLVPPAITSQPQPQTVQQGQNVLLSVVATDDHAWVRQVAEVFDRTEFGRRLHPYSSKQYR